MITTIIIHYAENREYRSQSVASEVEVGIVGIGIRRASNSSIRLSSDISSCAILLSRLSIRRSILMVGPKLNLTPLVGDRERHCSIYSTSKAEALVPLRFAHS